ncbi:hypothetical protein [Paraburkholderia sp. J10-1]|uniref:hypothetical protein n=1 Tax=Paraburkholderia sp. J10-1 TaxID=2805430 RepID=UPI002AB66F90|nr:hypothetical protein [Paraburkholderia sp. J10-1]
MNRLGSAALLDAWDKGHTLSANAWALWFAAACRPALAPGHEASDEPQQWPVGKRDRELLRVRVAAFGPTLEAVAACPACGAQAGFEVPGEALFAQACADEASVPRERVIDGFRLAWRPVTAGDLLAIEGAHDAGEAAKALLERCVRARRDDGSMVEVHSLPASVRAALGECLEAADPQASLRVALSCPACGHQWTMAFDIVSFLWHELSAWALRLLGEVHALAQAYGWSEADILALSAARRRRYLGMLTS